MLPHRHGVGPSVVAVPAGPWASVLDFLAGRFAAVPRAEWADRLARGDVLDATGRPVAASAPCPAGSKLHYYRSLPPEAPVAAEETVLFEDDWLVVADKPHFLPVTPGGKYLQETLLVRLKRRLGIANLVPLHRIDRETAGLVLLAKQPATRAAYEALFARRAVHKAYEAIAGFNPVLALPLERRSRLVDAPHFMQMQEQPGLPNAHTTVELLAVQGLWARYRLTPHTGKRHQLRVHMAALGLPLLGDRIYPRLLPERTDDPANPLRLLARSLAFDDPVTGQPRRFESRQALHFPQPDGPGH